MAQAREIGRGGMAGVLHFRREVEDAFGGFQHRMREMPYTRFRLAQEWAGLERIAVLVEHAGERRQVWIDGGWTYGSSAYSSRDVVYELFRRALALAEYLDSLRQGMRDLIDP